RWARASVAHDAGPGSRAEPLDDDPGASQQDLAVAACDADRVGMVLVAVDFAFFEGEALFSAAGLDERRVEIAAMYDEVAVLIPLLVTLAKVYSGDFLVVDGVHQNEGVGVEHLGLEHLHDAETIQNGVAVGRDLYTVAYLAHFGGARRVFCGWFAAGDAYHAVTPARSPCRHAGA